MIELASIPAMKMKDNLFDICCFLDLEIARDGSIHKIGAVFGERRFRWDRNAMGGNGLRELDDFVHDATFLVGHNIFRHDLPALISVDPSLKLLRIPAIDTLVLSPLSFPKNPYHRLVKDYKLVLDAVSDPVRDAELCATLFRDQTRVFGETMKTDPDALRGYAYCLDGDVPGNPAVVNGFPEFFAKFGSETATDEEFISMTLGLLDGRVCATTAARVLGDALSRPNGRWSLAYCLAWTRVAGHNSVLPSWVRHSFPEVSVILDQFRDVPCGRPDCAYCVEAHDPETLLRKFFGFETFRRDPDGGSLQRDITLSGLSGESQLGILPTGGGKSLCFQLPALARNYRRGTLTVVISPLQALMKDQVDNLTARTGTPFAGALYGLLTPPERGELLERVRRGDVAILYVSPEQLRNKSFRDVIAQREIGCWVFDEAHCLSKWGHDFRPDYLYAGRFIREFHGEDGVPPPIACFTATAKRDVIDEISQFFKRELGTELRMFQGDLSRSNLHFEVKVIKAGEKRKRIDQILRQRLPSADSGGAVVFRATRKATEVTAEFLQRRGWSAVAFHAGLKPPDKRRIQDEFIAGDHQVICATNAFGMGVDKADVRLVLHGDIPGSLENYIQEAGRAGRDRLAADCVLLYDENDVERQFQLGACSELSRGDIDEILRGLRRATEMNDDVVITAGELLRDEETVASFSLEDPDAPTKVKTAIAWLERAGFVERNQNQTSVFQCKPLVKSMAEAAEKARGFNIPDTIRRVWMAVLRKFINAEPDQPLTIDELAELPEMKAAIPRAREERGAYDVRRVSDTVVRALRDMATAGLVRKGVQLTAFAAKNAKERFRTLSALESELLNVMREEEPDTDGWKSLSLRKLNQALLDRGRRCAPETIRGLLHSLGMDGKGFADSTGSVDVRHHSKDVHRLKFNRSWEALLDLSSKRRRLAEITLDMMIAKIDAATDENAQVLVEFSIDEIEAALNRDAELSSRIKDVLAAIERGLMYLHEQRIVILQQGLSVFHQAMRVSIHPKGKRASYAGGDFAPLAEHYKERVFQVHVMNEYARLGVNRLRQAMNLVAAYFSMDKESFVKKFFPERESLLAVAATADSFHRIVDALNNPIQEAVVTADPDQNMLILAGPGSGKTRTVIHRCAYLLSIKRVDPRRLLVLCFNRDAMIELRRRLLDLVGPSARRVAVLTYHALAMRLVGRSLATASVSGDDEAVDFDGVILEAIDILNHKTSIPGVEPDRVRERLLSGFQHVLVDEYQDVDQNQYKLITALTGRILPEDDAKLSILAVGDDDQNIFTFRGANVGFIKRFQTDFQARESYLVENYRSTPAIIAAANRLIAKNRDRMKTDQPIRIDAARSGVPFGGRWERLDPARRGSVLILETNDESSQAVAVVDEMERLKSLDPKVDWSSFAVIARTRRELGAIRSLCEIRGVPVAWTMDPESSFPLHRVREIRRFLDHLGGKNGEWSRVEDLRAEFVDHNDDSPWTRLLQTMLNDCAAEMGEGEAPVVEILEFILETLMDKRRERRFGDGAFLSTAHGCKGLEFDHAFILGGDWNSGRQEEERRLYYVAATRARETLTLVHRREAENPFVSDLDASDVVKRTANVDGASLCRYETIGPRDLFLSHAGRRAAKNPIHRHLAALSFGDRLFPTRVGRNLELRNSHGDPVARFSRRGFRLWSDRLGVIERVSVMAMVTRTSEDEEDESHARKCRVQTWEFPVCEVKMTSAY